MEQNKKSQLADQNSKITLPYLALKYVNSMTSFIYIGSEYLELNKENKIIDHIINSDLLLKFHFRTAIDIKTNNVITQTFVKMLGVLSSYGDMSSLYLILKLTALTEENESYMINITKDQINELLKTEIIKIFEVTFFEELKNNKIIQDRLKKCLNFLLESLENEVNYWQFLLVSTNNNKQIGKHSFILYENKIEIYDEDQSFTQLPIFTIKFEDWYIKKIHYELKLGHNQSETYYKDAEIVYKYFEFFPLINSCGSLMLISAFSLQKSEVNNSFEYNKCLGISKMNEEFHVLLRRAFSFTIKAQQEGIKYMNSQKEMQNKNHKDEKEYEKDDKKVEKTNASSEQNNEQNKKNCDINGDIDNDAKSKEKSPEEIREIVDKMLKTNIPGNMYENMQNKENNEAERDFKKILEKIANGDDIYDNTLQLHFIPDENFEQYPEHKKMSGNAFIHELIGSNGKADGDYTAHTDEVLI